MKTETYPEEANLTTGQILRQAREKHELSQQTVADRLCLKLSTVRDIEEDNIPSNISPTFLRGYIRAYAKLVQVPESEILSVLDKQMPSKAIKTSPMQSFSAGKKRKRRDGWLMKITWVVIILLLGMTVLWWWQDYKAQQTAQSPISEQSGAKSAQVTGSEKSSVAPGAGGNDISAPAKNSQSGAASQDNAPQEKTSPAEVNGAVVNKNVSSDVPVSSIPKAESLPVNQSVTNQLAQPATNAISENMVSSTNAEAKNSVVSPSSVDVSNISAVSNNELVLNFKGECWLQVVDAKGKVLFSGIKKKGNSLKFSGKSLYSLTIGAPSEVEVLFQGKPVDLSSFVKKNATTKLQLK
ncbi:cytoskeleton protein RodZ [Xenorhabdus anantnagensis]|uniref:Cytoskeleton protein RodZ n=1 Tax=Xenorhabdus anantnagensis TaxID=3025875 RepID=A0ABT5LVN7_9GAMM|nr:cytoskeleton protein RodZ [Xenorhabdus anantnagensis]MDC9597139.1 cytoskeleton protein RodZ [Xenorhabdus anantnagensis]